MNKGLSNFEIDKSFKYEENEEIKKNYMGNKHPYGFNNKIHKFL